MFEIPRPYSRPSSTKALGWNPGTCRSHGSCPEYDVSMCPLNMRLGPPPAPVADPEHVRAPVLDLLPLDLRPMSRNVSRISSAIASSEPVKLGVPIACEAHSTSRSRSTASVKASFRPRA